MHTVVDDFGELKKAHHPTIEAQIIIAKFRLKPGASAPITPADKHIDQALQKRHPIAIRRVQIQDDTPDNIPNNNIGRYNDFHR